MFISELNGRVGLFRLARWQMTAAFIMSAILATAVGGWGSMGRTELVLLAASSLFAIMLATTTYFACIYSAGPRIAALMFSLTSPFALLLGYLVFGETVTALQGLGVVLVLTGVVLAISPPLAVIRSALAGGGAGAALNWTGIGFGIVTAMGQALGNLFARPAMAAGTDPFAAMAVRSGLAAMFFIALMVFPFARADRSPVTLRNLATATTAAWFGTVMGMSLLMAALARGHVGLVSTLSSVAPVVILPMLWIRTGQPPSPSAWAGALVAMLGTALISLG